MKISVGSYKIRVEIILLMVVVFWVMFGHLLCGCCKVGLFEGIGMMKQFIQQRHHQSSSSKKTTEGFVGGNYTPMGPEFAGTKTPDYIMNPSTWSMPTLTYSPGTTPDSGVNAVLNRPEQQIPLPEGQLDILANTEFKPECCPNAYSSSTGCACLNMKTYYYLHQRGGNNVPYDIL